MRSLVEFIQDTEYDDLVVEYYLIAETEETMNESFKSSLLKKLAKEIADAEKKNNQRKIEREKSSSYYKADLVSFASIFGPKEEKAKWNSKDGIQGLKWNEIEDKDFQEFPRDSKELKKIIKEIYSGSLTANIVFCAGETPVMFLKGYRGEKDPVRMFYLVKPSENRSGGAKVAKKTKYSYQERDLKWDECWEMIQNYVKDLTAYVLEVKSDMIKKYDDLHIARKESQKDVVNYDEKSLAALLKEQKARYKALAEEMRAKKLQGDPKALWDDIKKANDEVVALAEKVMSNPENLSGYFDIGRLLSYVSYAYQEFYKSKKYKKEADDAEGGGFTGEFSKRHSDSAINDAKKYLDEVRKMIADIEKEIK